MDANNSKASKFKGAAFIWQYIKEYKIAVFFVLIFIAVSTYLQVQAPRIMGESINNLGSYIKAYNTPGADSAVAYSDFLNSILRLLGAFILSAIGMFMYTYIMAGTASRASATIRTVLFDKLQNLSIKFFDEANDGDILSRFTNDVDNIATLLNQAFIQIISSVALFVSIAYTMFTENSSLGSVVLLLALVNIILIMFVTKQAKKYVSKQQEKLGTLNGYIDEKISGQKLIITTGTEEKTFDDFIPFNEDYRETSKKGQAYSNILFPLVNGFMMMSIGLIIFFGADLVINQTLTVGSLVAFITYTQRFFQPLTQIVSQYSVFRLGLTGASRVDEILQEKEDVIDSNGAIVLEGIHDSVKLENITFGYNPAQIVLDNVSIEVKHGQKVALVGPTGSGKTTIMNLLNRFYDVDAGDILFDGHSIKDIRLDSLRHNVGIVLQDTVLFSGTIRDNIVYGKKDASDEQVIEAAKAAKIHDYIMNLDDGYDTEIDNSNSTFSVGQKQLISIARTILADPELLILDEATSNVDTVTEEKIQEAMNNILVDRTSFVIAHRLKTILDADKIVVLKEGRVIEQGNHEELLALNGFYAELYINQFVLEN